MRAIWREAAANQAPRFSRQKCASRFRTAAPPIARKRYSYKGFRHSGGLRQTIESPTEGCARRDQTGRLRSTGFNISADGISKLILRPSNASIDGNW